MCSWGGIIISSVLVFPYAQGPQRNLFSLRLTGGLNLALYWSVSSTRLELPCASSHKSTTVERRWLGASAPLWLILCVCVNTLTDRGLTLSYVSQIKCTAGVGPINLSFSRALSNLCLERDFTAALDERFHRAVWLQWELCWAPAIESWRGDKSRLQTQRSPQFQWRSAFIYPPSREQRSVSYPRKSSDGN